MLLPIMSMNRYRLLPIQVRVTLIIIQGALTLWRDVPQQAVYRAPLPGSDGGHSGAPQIAVEQKFIILQCDWSHHLGVWAALGHLIQVDIAPIGEVQLSLSHFPAPPAHQFSPVPQTVPVPAPPDRAPAGHSPGPSCG